MKVQRCPSCRAGYSVERLEPGATFECRRCHATIEVANASAGDTSISIGLLVAGILMLLALFLYANPRFGVERSWPWEYFSRAGSLEVQVRLVVWALLGLWGVLTALIPSFDHRSLLTLGLGTLGLILATATDPAGLGIDLPRSLPWMAGATVMAAGFALVLHERFGLATRLLLLAGGLVFVWLAVGRFTADTADVIRLEDDVAQLLGGTLPAPQSGPIYLWGTLAPQIATLLAGVLALLIGMGVRARPLAWIGGVVLMAAMLLPAATSMGNSLEGQAFSLGVLGIALLDGLQSALLQGGVALWLIASLATADLVRTAEVPS